MMTASQFSPVYLPFPVSIRVIETGFQQHAHSCWLDAAAKVVSVYYFETTGGTLASKMSVGNVLSSGQFMPSSASGAGAADVVDVDNLQSTSQAARPRTMSELESESAFTQLLIVLVNKTMEGVHSVAGRSSVHLHYW
jgi:hypothetical protein